MKNPLRKKEMRVPSLAREGLLEKEMATHSSILARKTPWTEEPGGLWFQSQTRLKALRHWSPTMGGSYSQRFWSWGGSVNMH